MCPGKNVDDNEVLNFNHLIKVSREVEILGIKINIKSHKISL